MVIQVTQEHINRGVREHCRSCPVALAVNEAFGVTNAEVNLLWIVINRGKSSERHYEFPLHVQRRIARFDRNQPMYPFQFELGEPIDLRSVPR